VDTAVVVGVLITSIGYSVLSVYYLLDFEKRFVFTFDDFAYYFQEEHENTPRLYEPPLPGRIYKDDPLR